MVPDGVTVATAAICTAESWPRDGAIVPPADPMLPTAASLGGMAGIADTVGGTAGVTNGGATGATTTGFGCNTAGSSFFTTGACVHADNKIAVETSSAVMRDRFTARMSGRRNEVVITLMFPFKFEEVVVPARRAIRVIAAYCRTALINRATTFGLIKKHTHRFVHRVFTMPKHAHGFAFVLDLLGKFFAGNIHRDAMMLGQTSYIGGLGFDVVVATAVAGAFGAVVRIFGCHHAYLKLCETHSKGRYGYRHNGLRKYLLKPDGML